MRQKGLVGPWRSDALTYGVIANFPCYCNMLLFQHDTIATQAEPEALQYFLFLFLNFDIANQLYCNGVRLSNSSDG